jgi:hypothetical protein
MVVLNIKCKKCNKICNAMHFQQNFENWTSGDNDIDKFIQDTQLMVHEDSEISQALEWISYDRFCAIRHIEENLFEKEYIVKWIDGCIDKWDNKNQNWKRHQNIFVTLKALNDSNNITLESMNEVWLIYLKKKNF